MAVMPEGAAGYGAEQYQVQGVSWEILVVTATYYDFHSFTRDYLQISPPQILAAGRISVDQRLRLPGNAVVRSPFEVTVQAGRARWIRAGDVAEIRTADLSTDASASTAQDRTSVTVDFGGLRTVSAVGLVSSASIQVIQVKPWTGAGFAPQAVVGYPYTIDTGSTRITPLDDPEITLPSEIRTERLQVILAGSPSEDEVRESLLVLLPDLPADVQLSIDGGPAVWSAPGPVRDGVEGWTLDEASGLFRQKVDLAADITALLGDPDADVTDEVELRVTLQASQPGVLLLAVPEPSAPEVADAVRHRVRATVDPARREIDFEEEGARTVPLQLPAWVDQVESLEVRLSGEFEPERIFPPLGPDFPTVPGGMVPRVEMVLDANRAAAVRIPDLHGLDGLVAVRLPLLTVDGDAEVQVLLLEDLGLEPGAAVEGGVSEPATVSGADHATWHTFSFPEEVEVDPAAPPIVAVAVTRGTVAWALTDDVAAGAVWQGPLTGPWLPLPPLRLGEPRGRTRIVGRASKEREPVAPMLAGVVGDEAGVPLTPTPEGAVQAVQPDAPATPDGGSVELELVARGLGSVRVEEVVAVVTRTT